MLEALGFAWERYELASKGAGARRDPLDVMLSLDRETPFNRKKNSARKARRKAGRTEDGRYREVGDERRCHLVRADGLKCADGITVAEG